MGVPLAHLEEVQLTLDELEALRLADLEGKYQEAAAEQMGISRSTFSRTVEAAHRKVAEALVLGKAIMIQGGPIAEDASPDEGSVDDGCGGCGRADDCCAGAPPTRASHCCSRSANSRR
jgi:predicted DNA-binding protein (UPF0251 family)